jgi:D-alanyl-D-alanine carboxypeptidase
VKRTAPKITEIADAEPMPAPIAAEKPVRIASAGASIPPKPEQPAARTVTRAPETQVASAAPADQPAPGSTEPIRPLLVRTLSVKAAAKSANATSLFTPEPISARAALMVAAPFDAPKPESKLDTPPPPPPGARPGVLGVLTGKDFGNGPAADTVKDVAARTMTASIAPVPQVRAPRRETPARPAIIASAPIAAAPAPAKVEAPAVADSKPRSGWILQVGAFEDQAEAKEKLAAARVKASAILKNADSYTEIFSKGDKRYFRARFAGLKESAAEQACKELQKSKMTCFALRN